MKIEITSANVIDVLQVVMADFRESDIGSIGGLMEVADRQIGRHATYQTELSVCG